MDRKLTLVLAVVLLSAFLFPYCTQAADKNDNYIVVKGGMFKPTGSDLSDYTTAFNGEIAFGHYFTRNIALEGSAGYFRSAANTNYSSSYSYYTPVKVDVDVVPVTAAIKVALPCDPFEFYGIGGLGAYFVWTKLEGSYLGIPYTDKSSQTVFGGFLGGGANYNITKDFFIGLEGKYFYTTRVSAIDYELYGIQATFNIGFRF